ncbi:hypothetical protein Tco_0290516 [Tanacetum coccineum]
MKRGFLSQKGSGVGRGVKENDLNRDMKNTSSGMQNSLDDTAVLESFPPLSMPITTTARIAPGKSSRAICERFANTAYGFFLGKKMVYPFVANYVRNTWGKYGLVCSMFSSSTELFSFQFSSIDELDAMLENGPCEDGLSAIATKLGTPLMLDSYTSDMCMQSWGAGEKKTVKKPSQTFRGVLVGPKIEPTIEVSNSNPFDILNLVDNDVEFGTNRGTTNLVNNVATSSGSSFMNVDNSSSSATPIIDKIRNFEDLLTSGQVILEDKVVNPLKKVEFSGEYDRKDEVASVDNDMARSMASKRVGLGT